MYKHQRQSHIECWYRLYEWPWSFTLSNEFTGKVGGAIVQGLYIVHIAANRTVESVCLSVCNI